MENSQLCRNKRLIPFAGNESLGARCPPRSLSPLSRAPFTIGDRCWLEQGARTSQDRAMNSPHSCSEAESRQVRHQTAHAAHFPASRLLLRGGDLVADALADDLTLELRKGQQHVQGQATHRRRRVELLRD